MITNDGKDKAQAEAHRTFLNRDLRVEVRFLDAETDEHLFSTSHPVIIGPGDSFTVHYPKDGFEFTVS